MQIIKYRNEAIYMIYVAAQKGRGDKGKMTGIWRDFGAGRDRSISEDLTTVLVLVGSVLESCEKLLFSPSKFPWNDDDSLPLVLDYTRRVWMSLAYHPCSLSSCFPFVIFILVIDCIFQLTQVLVPSSEVGLRSAKTWMTNKNRISCGRYEKLSCSFVMTEAIWLPKMNSTRPWSNLRYLLMQF